MVLHSDATGSSGLRWKLAHRCGGKTQMADGVTDAGFGCAFDAVVLSGVLPVWAQRVIAMVNRFCRAGSWDLLRTATIFQVPLTDLMDNLYFVRFLDMLNVKVVVQETVFERSPHTYFVWSTTIRSTTIHPNAAYPDDLRTFVDRRLRLRHGDRRNGDWRQGKSTVVSLIRELFQDHLVPVLSSNIEEKFGLSGVSKDLINICPEKFLAFSGRAEGCVQRRVFSLPLFRTITFHDEMRTYMQCWPLLKSLLACKFPGEVVMEVDLSNSANRINLDFNVRVKVSRELRRVIPALCALCGNENASRLVDVPEKYISLSERQPSATELMHILEAPSAQRANRRKRRLSKKR